MKLEPYTDSTPMPWGEHKGKALKDVPTRYLAELSKQPWIKDYPQMQAWLDGQPRILELEDESGNEGLDYVGF